MSSNSNKATDTESSENTSGVRLKECRKAQRLTLAELAEKAGQLQPNSERKCNPNHIGAIEGGRRKLSLNYANLFSKVLGVRSEYLLGTSPYKTDKELWLATHAKDLKKQKDFHYTSGPLAALQTYLDYLGIEWSYDIKDLETAQYSFHMWTEDGGIDYSMDGEEAEALADYIFQFATETISQTIGKEVLWQI